MNILDNFILIVLIAVFLIFCYKKKKFPFRSRENKENPKKPGSMETPQASQTPPNNAPYNPNMAFIPQMYPYGMANFQNPYGNNQDIFRHPGSLNVSPTGICLCRLIPWTFRFDPLPFADTGASGASADNTIREDITPLGVMLDSEIQSLNADGYIVTGISVVSLPLGDCAVRALFCITCSSGETGHTNGINRTGR